MHQKFEDLLDDLAATSGVSREVIGEVLSRVVIAAPQPVPRVDIAEGTMLAHKLPQLSQATVSKATKVLLDRARMLSAEPPRADRPGRPIVPLALDEEVWGILGVHVHHRGGRPVGLTGAFVNLRSIVLTSAHVDLEGSGILSAVDLAEAIVGLADNLMSTQARDAGSREVLGLGIEIGGHVHAGQVIESTNAGWHEVDIQGPIADKLAMPVVVDNDVNAFAVWETYRHRYRERDIAVVAVFDQGIGGGLIVDGRVYRGSHGMAGEIGHLTVNYALADQDQHRPVRRSQRERFKDPCPCGQYGHVDALATPLRILGELGSSDLQMAAGSPLLAKDGKPTRAASVFREAGKALGRGIVDLVQVLNPGRILLLLPSPLANPLPDSAGAEYRQAVQDALGTAFSTGAQDAQLTVESLGQLDDHQGEIESLGVVGARAAALTVLDAFIDRSRGS